MLLGSSAFVTQKPQSPWHSGVNMKAIHHECFWKRKKSLSSSLWTLHNEQVRAEQWVSETQYCSLSIHRRIHLNCQSVVHRRYKQKIRLQLYSQTFTYAHFWKSQKTLGLWLLDQHDRLYGCKWVERGVMRGWQARFFSPRVEYTVDTHIIEARHSWVCNWCL